jgi:hypothetical protein
MLEHRTIDVLTFCRHLFDWHAVGPTENTELLWSEANFVSGVFCAHKWEVLSFTGTPETEKEVISGISLILYWSSVVTILGRCPFRVNRLF